MRTIGIACTTMLVALAPSAGAAPQQLTASIEARTNALVPGSSEGVTKSVTIPASCTYVSHSLGVLEREPAPAAERDGTASTSYSAALRRDSRGRVDAVALTVVARAAPSLQASSIAVRLSVVMQCE